MSVIDDLNKLYQSNISLLTTLDIENLLQIKSTRTLEDLIKRLIQENVLTSLEKGKYYVTSKQPSTFEIANFLYSPSYISFETALNYHGLLSQFPLEITSATLGKKSEKRINDQLYVYSQIDKKLFTGYYKESNYLMATKEKALFDEVYLISKSIKSESILQNYGKVFMISAQQLKIFAKNYKINENIVAREFVQVTFLKELYEQRFSKEVFFKGGTAIRLIYGGKRFSEDLDFTVTTNEHEFLGKINIFFKQLTNKYPFTFKERETLTGKTFLLIAELPSLNSNIFVKLDFSMRENVIDPVQEILKTDYPIIVHAFINCLSKNEISAEKIRAILKRKKYRDLYDLWVLYELGATSNIKLITEKLSYYGEKLDKPTLLHNLKKFKKEEFIMDLKPFVTISERDKLGDFFDYINRYLEDEFRKL